MTTATVSGRRYHPNDLLAMPGEGKAYELNDLGELEERAMGSESSEIGIEIAMLLHSFVRAHGLGRIFGSDVGLKLWPAHPRRLRRPDVAFLANSRLSGPSPRGHLETAPNLVVEVVSPRDIAANVHRKVLEYFEAGVEAVWVVWPESRSVVVHLPNGTSREYRGDDVLSGGEVLPGFAVPVAQIFPEH